nr:hypothetical protein [Tanacetum cinerariifolium]
MNHLGQLLRNFRRKLRQTYILPNQNTLSKLNEVPVKYSAIVKVEEWVNFIKSKIKKFKPYEEPSCSILWLKGRVNKDGEFLDDEIRSVGDKLNEIEDKIKKGTLKVDHGTDAIKVILGKENGGYARGVGSGVTYKRYFDLSRSRQASDERIVLLQSQLDNERRERQEKELEIQNLSNKMSQTEGMVTKLMNQLAAQGDQLKSMSTQLTPPDLRHFYVPPMDINPIDSTDEEGGTPVVGCENDASLQKSNGLATLKMEMEMEMETRETVNSVVSKKMTRSIRKAIKCKLWHLKKSIIIDLGTVYETDGKQMLYNKELPEDCYKVFTDKSLVDATCITDVGNNGFKIVKYAVGSFFAWPKNQVVLDPKFWTTVAVKHVNDVTRLQALTDKKKVENSIFLSIFLIAWKQVGDLSTHTTKYTSPALTQKVFANMRRVGKGFSRVKTPLFEGMLIEQVDEEGDADEHVEDVNAGDAAHGDDSTAHGEFPSVTEEPSIPSPTPPTQPPQPPQDIPSTKDWTGLGSSTKIPLPLSLDLVSAGMIADVVDSDSGSLITIPFFLLLGAAVILAGATVSVAVGT